LAFHPTQPNLLALGIFTGQIMILDIASQEDIDPIMMRSTTDDLTHREPISGIEWVHNAVSNDNLLASIGADGRILLWTLSNKLSNPISGIRLAPTSIYHGHGILPNKHSTLGGMAFAFSPIVDGLVVAGTEAGGLIRCQIITPTQYHGRPDIRDGGLVWTAHAAALVHHSNELHRQIERATIVRGLRRVDLTEIWAAPLSPTDLYPVRVSLVYDTHAGPVRSIVFSRHHRHLFLTCSADGYFRVYHVLRSAPILSLDVSGTGLTDARWSHCRPTVALITDAKGVVHVMDLLKNAHGPILSLPMNQTGAPAISLALNKTDTTFMSSGDLEGNVSIWTLSTSLDTIQPNELVFFEHWNAISDEGTGHAHI
jgi:WD40 repeat protein